MFLIALFHVKSKASKLDCDTATHQTKALENLCYKVTGRRTQLKVFVNKWEMLMPDSEKCSNRCECANPGRAAPPKDGTQTSLSSPPKKAENT